MKAAVEGFAALASSIGRSDTSDVKLAAGVVAIVCLMILPLPLVLIDTLIAASMLFGMVLLLLAIYIPSPTAFSSFPSVLLLTTLFRLSLSIAITRLILLDADAGAIIHTFGEMVVGGNLVVGIVIFLIITVVQFVVIAKGAERVAEVAARFSLDAMPGKQLSIDSDLRSGLMDKEDAKRQRKHLQLESQLHGSLDGAMKFVKGDAIAGIIIIIVNILGGLAIGVLQKGMPLGEAMHTYTILTIGDGLVAQIPALLGAISAGLVVTRTASEEQDENLGSAIAKQIGRYPRIRVIAGGLALLAALVPGFPAPVFVTVGIILLLSYTWQYREQMPLLRGRLSQGGTERRGELEEAAPTPQTSLGPPAALRVRVPQAFAAGEARSAIRRAVEARLEELRDTFGVPIPGARIEALPVSDEQACEVQAHGLRIARSAIDTGHPAPVGSTGDEPGGQALVRSAGDADDTAERVAEAVAQETARAVRANLAQFLGTQETSDLVDQWSERYPQLTKEVLRAVPPQRVALVLQRLVAERLPIRDLRDVFEALADAGQKEKNPALIAEYVRMALKRRISDGIATPDRNVLALLAHPEFEDAVRQAMRDASEDQLPGIDPKMLRAVTAEVREAFDQAGEDARRLVMLCSMDVRRHIRRLLESEYPELPVVSFQELAADLQVRPVAQIQGAAQQDRQTQNESNG